MLLRPWDFPGKVTGVDCHFLLQEIFPTQGSNLGLPHCRQMLYRLSHQKASFIIYIHVYFRDSSVGKESSCNAGNLSSIPGLGRIAGEGKGYLLQYSGLENPMDCIIHRVAKSWTWVSDFHFTHIYTCIRIYMHLLWSSFVSQFMLP